MNKVYLPTLIVIFISSFPGIAKDRAVSGSGSQDSRPLNFTDIAPIAELPLLDGGIENIDGGQKHSGHVSGRCTIRPNILHDIRIETDPLTLLTLNLPQEMFDMIRNNDSCPEGEKDYHGVKSTCKKNGNAFEVHLSSDGHLATWSIQMFMKKIKRLDVEEKWHSSTDRFETKQTIKCGEALTS